jgi:hypothetical protein
MAENTLTVPAEYVELFRLAVAKEVEDNARLTYAKAGAS